MRDGSQAHVVVAGGRDRRVCAREPLEEPKIRLRVVGILHTQPKVSTMQKPGSPCSVDVTNLHSELKHVTRASMDDESSVHVTRDAKLAKLVRLATNIRIEGAVLGNGVDATTDVIAAGCR